MDQEGSSFKCDALESTIAEIQQETSSQHSQLKELKERHTTLKETLEKKMTDLQDRKDKTMALAEELKVEEFRIKDKEEAYKAELEVTEASRDEVKIIQDKLKAERENQIESLKLYEKKMAALAQSFREGPRHYDRKNMTQKIRNLEHISAGIQKEIEGAALKIDECKEKFITIAKDGANFNENSSNLLKQIEDDIERIKIEEMPILRKCMESLEKLLDDQRKKGLNSVDMN